MRLWRKKLYPVSHLCGIDGISPRAFRFQLRKAQLLIPGIFNSHGIANDRLHREQLPLVFSALFAESVDDAHDGIYHYVDRAVHRGERIGRQRRLLNIMKAHHRYIVRHGQAEPVAYGVHRPHGQHIVSAEDRIRTLAVVSSRTAASQPES